MLVTRKQKVQPLAALLAVLLLTSCRDSNEQPPAPVAATPVDAATAGSITAEVRFLGNASPAQAINMSSAPGCAKLHDGTVYDRPVAAENGALSNAVVYIKDGLQGWIFAPPADPAVLDQKGCLYEPRVAAAMVGQGVQFENSDTEAHNVHGRPQLLSAWNFMMSRAGQTRTLYFDKPEMGIAVGCDIHPWMKAYLCVMPNPYFGVSGADGRVQLTNVPPGNYTLAVWHESLGAMEQRISLSPKGEAAVSFTYQAK